MCVCVFRLFPTSPSKKNASQLPVDATLQQLRVAVAAQNSSGGAAASAAGTLLRDGAPLNGAAAASLSSLGVKSGDLLMCVPDPQQQGAGAPSSSSAPPDGVPDPAAALAALRADPAALAVLPPPLQAAVRAGDLETLGAAMR